MTSPCIFCAIAAGSAPASLVFEDERCLAFLDIRPVNPGHLLIVPRVHVAHLAELEPAQAAHLMRVAQPLAASLRAAGAIPGTGVRCEGVNLFLADGEAAGQEVFHVHLHVIPRFAGDGFRIRFGPHYGELPARAELDRVASALQACRANL